MLAFCLQILTPWYTVPLRKIIIAQLSVCASVHLLISPMTALNIVVSLLIRIYNFHPNNDVLALCIWKYMSSSSTLEDSTVSNNTCCIATL
jgi:hypothetical protein